MDTNHTHSPPPLAYDIRGLGKAVGKCRTTIFQEIAEGRLTARKSGGKLIILHEDAKAWLQSLPIREPSRKEAVNDAG